MGRQRLVILSSTPFVPSALFSRAAHSFFTSSHPEDRDSWYRELSARKNDLVSRKFVNDRGTFLSEKYNRAVRAAKLQNFNNLIYDVKRELLIVSKIYAIDSINLE